MQLLEDRIRKDGKVREGNVLKVDSFLNHQMDVNLFREIGKEFQRRFAGEEITKILTIEASGIGIACVVAEIFNVPVVFAKKTQTKNIAGDVYTTKVESFTHGRVYDIIVSKEFLGKGDKVLLIDDFLANGKALEGLATLVQDSGAELVGAGVVIEKGFQIGGKLLRDRGIHLESLAIVDGMDDKTGEITFRKQYGGVKMANLIARIAVLLVLAAAGMVLADRKEKIDLSVSLLLFLAAVNVTSFFSLKDNRIVVVMILTVYFLLYAGAKELLRRRAEKKRK